MSIRKITHSLTLLLALIATPMVSAEAQSFDSAPHVLVLPGHTNSLSAGPNGEVLVTCDYKTLDGRVPRPGEPCNGEPTLAISVEDLKNLRYISEAQDNNELVTRVYEKYDDIVFIVSPDFEVEYGNPAYQHELSTVTVKRPEIPKSIYEAYANQAQAALKTSGPYGGEYMLGVTFGPYDYNQAFDSLGDINPLQDKWRPLAEYTLIFLPAKTEKSTLIHEFIHFLLYRSRSISINFPIRLTELQKNRAIGKYLKANVLSDSPAIQIDDDLLAAYELSDVLYYIEHIDDALPDEIEVDYFISKYRKELGLIPAADDHRNSFWHFSDHYKKTIDFLDRTGKGDGAPPPRSLRYVQENLPLKIGEVFRPNYYRNIWNNIKMLSSAYPKNLLGDEINPESGTMMFQFLRDIGTRTETAVE